MQPNTDEPLEQAIATLNQLMALVHNAGFTDSAHLIAMAKMQMQLDLNGVTDREFRALCDAAEGRTFAKPIARARPGHPRIRREAEMTTTRRSWICASDGSTRRGGRRRSGTT